jgi:hypothetical protein
VKYALFLKGKKTSLVRGGGVRIQNQVPLKVTVTAELAIAILLALI